MDLLNKLSNDFGEIRSHLDKEKFLKDLQEQGITDKDIIDFASKTPAFEHVFPRRIPRQSGYPDPRLLPATLCSNLEQIEQELVDVETSISAVTLLSYIGIADKYDFPIYHLSHELAKAFSLTSIGDKFNLGDCHWPFPAFSLLLPQEFAIPSTDGPISSIAIYRVDEPLIERPSWSPVNLDVRAHERFGIIGVCDKPPCLAYTMHWDGSVENIPESGTEDVLQFGNNSEFPELRSKPFNASDAENQKRVISQITNIFGLCMVYLNTIQNGVTGGEQARKAKTKGNRIIEALYNPRWIGEHYRIRREDGGGTHASPYGHFRRGSTRNQAYGPKYSLHRTVLIDPVWVGGRNG